MKKCISKDCPHGAKFAPRICVPAALWPIDAHQPLSCIMGIELCEDCFNEIKPEHFFGPEVSKLPNNMRGMFELIAKGKQAPDFDRAYIERVNINSKEYAQYQRLIKKDEDKKGTVH